MQKAWIRALRQKWSKKMPGARSAHWRSPFTLRSTKMAATMMATWVRHAKTGGGGGADYPSPWGLRISEENSFGQLAAVIVSVCTALRTTMEQKCGGGGGNIKAELWT